jgi:cobalt/nickel transport system permease protein
MRPEIMEAGGVSAKAGESDIRNIFIGFIVAAVIIGGALSWFASADPDGLEWAMFRTSGQEELSVPGGVHTSLASVQEKTAFLPDYGFKKSGMVEEPSAAWPAVDPGTSVSGLVGGLLVLFMAGLIGLVLKRRKVIA